MIKLLQISDIHWLCGPRALDPYDDMRTELLIDLRNYVNIHGSIDHLLICGDIAYQGSKDEYENAMLFIKEICNAIRCKESEVYIVPGNHDKERNGNSEYIRKCLHKGLSEEDANENLLQDILNSEFDLLKTLHKPFKDYADFGANFLGVDPLMAKCFESDNNESYDPNTDTLYWKQELGDGLGAYKVMLYGINSALCSDKFDFNGKEGDLGHKLFLSKLAYNISNSEWNTLNILMAHHPLLFLTSNTHAKEVIDKKFKIQFYGHVHLQSSDDDNAIHIHSGALQPHHGGENKKYFPVYNIVEIDITVENNETDKLSVKLMAQKWNKETSKFEEYTDESTKYNLLLEHSNRWSKIVKPKIVRSVLPNGVSKRDVMIKFHGHKNRKAIITKIYPDAYRENKSCNANCIPFLSRIEENNDWDKLWNEIKE